MASVVGKICYICKRSDDNLIDFGPWETLQLENTYHFHYFCLVREKFHSKLKKI